MTDDLAHRPLNALIAEALSQRVCARRLRPAGFARDNRGSQNSASTFSRLMSGFVNHDECTSRIFGTVARVRQFLPPRIRRPEKRGRWRNYPFESSDARARGLPRGRTATGRLSVGATIA